MKRTYQVSSSDSRTQVSSYRVHMMIKGNAIAPSQKEIGGGSLYSQWCLYHLRTDFQRVRLADLQSALKHHAGNFIPAYRAIAAAFEGALLKEQNSPPKHGFLSLSRIHTCAKYLLSGICRHAKSCTQLDIKRLRAEKWLPYTGLKLMKTGRQVEGVIKPYSTCELFEKDLSALKAALITSRVEVPTLECGCCCADIPFEEMVQCADGHLICFTCLRRSVEESTFGSLPASGSLLCLDMTGCDKSIPESEIKRVVQAELFLKFEQRQAMAAIAKARLEGLVYCPFCNSPCEVDDCVSVLKCPEKSCLKESCVKCKEPSHVPLHCEEVEPAKTNHRNQVEEAMTKSVVRQCPACKAELIKEFGCNMVKCRCGQTMCYACRKAISDYSHFSVYDQELGKLKCTVCRLWEKEDHNAVLLAVKKAAIATKAKEDATILAREIGPKEALFSKTKAFFDFKSVGRKVESS